MICTLNQVSVMGSAVTVQMGDGEDMFTYNAAAVHSLSLVLKFVFSKLASINIQFSLPILLFTGASRGATAIRLGDGHIW
jgi:hypothetical protein